jgi:hypothetical protein
MLTRLSTPSPFPQTPARQTAPAAQRPAAQRQGYLEHVFKDAALYLESWKKRAQKAPPNSSRKKEWVLELSAKAGNLSLMNIGLKKLFYQGRGCIPQVRQEITESNPGLMGLFDQFIEELEGKNRAEQERSLEERMNEALRLSFDLLNLRNFISDNY